MIKYTPFAALLVIGLNGFAQNVGIGTNTPNSSAQLDITSTTKGMLLPRMTSTQRNGIINPAKGLLVYDTELIGLYQYNGAALVAVSAGAATLNLPYTASLSYAGNALQIDNAGTTVEATTSGNQPAIKATATGVGSYGVLGRNDIQGGIALGGTSLEGTAVYGFSSGSGTGLRGISTSGYALVSSGNVRFTGGNTSPAAGAVLTSIDHNGIAVWKKPKQDMAFELAGVYSSFIILAHNVWQKMHFNQEPYDSDNRTVPTTSASINPSMSSFVVPVTGIYEFEIGIGLKAGGDQRIWSQEVQLMVNRAGNVFAAHTMEGNPNHLGNVLDYRAMGGAQCRLVAGDIVYVNVRQTTNTSTSVIIMTGSDVTFFSGHLVYAE